ncbi:Dabb family protein [Serratia quinivorans]|uniref:Dabb family protein n=1 Tax=Serratia quinivorans TaxID=137545 RepID=UPI0034C6B16F
MYNHIILFRFAPNVTHERCLSLLAGLGGLKNHIAEIRGFSYGVNDESNAYGKDYKYAFVMSFDNVEDRMIYQQHVLHQEYIHTYLNPYIDDAIVFDMICC